MKLISLFVAAAVSTVAIAGSFTLQYDPIYDTAGESMDVVACSELATEFPTFGSLPKFPNIGAFAAVSGFGSPSCGTCWELTTDLVSAPLFAIAIDHAGAGLINLSEEAMNTLTNGQAVALGHYPVTANQVASSLCGL